MTQPKPTVFLDRDGTISEEAGYLNHEDRLKLIPVCAEAIKLLNKNNIQTVVVTNQAGVARGYFDEELLKKILKKMENELEKEGAHLDKIYYCPHHPNVGPEKYRKDCNCRKPKTGMIDMAKQDLPIDFAKSYMIGDRISDIYFGKMIGVKSILVLTGYGKGEYTYQREQWKTQPDFIAENILDAVKWILKDLGINI